MELYLSVKVYSTDEILMALLTQFEFESFEEYDDHFIAYITESNVDDAIREEIIGVIAKYTNEYTIEKVEPQNWNAIWEASFQPVFVNDFCQIRADFHPALDHIKYDLVINPKMAFGTGHHATTHSMIASMENLHFDGKSVFDFGCGTGILAILASKLGASGIDALDIEHESYLNTLENSQINNVVNINVYEGDISAAPSSAYDIILANINRNILIKYCDELFMKLKSGGDLLLSGVLSEERQIVVSAYENKGMKLQTFVEKDGWVCGHFRKES